MGSTAELRAPTIDEVLAARERIRPHLPRTPLYTYPTLNELAGADVWVKHENHLPVGAFKVRGGINLISQLTEDERRRGVIAASTGNHGQSVAFAAQRFGVRAVVCVPENSNGPASTSTSACSAWTSSSASGSITTATTSARCSR